MADAPDDERKQREERARRLVRRVLAKGGTARLYTSEFGKRFYQARMERETPEKLVEFARAGDREAHELLREYARGAARTGMHVPTALVEYVWECFIEGQPPAPKGPSGKGKGIRDTSIAVLMKVIQEETGLPMFRNPQYRNKKTGPQSVASIVAQELNLSESRVENIWNERSGRVATSPQK